jgi:hypothetical protein
VLHIVLYLFVLELSTNQPFKGEDGIGGVHNCLSLSWKTDEALSVLREGHH